MKNYEKIEEVAKLLEESGLDHLCVIEANEKEVTIMSRCKDIDALSLLEHAIGDVIDTAIKNGVSERDVTTALLKSVFTVTSVMFDESGEQNG